MPLPDYMTPQEEDAVLARMLGTLPATLDKSEGSFLWDGLAPAAIEMAAADDRLRYVFDLTFAQTSFGEFLDRRAEEHGVIRKQATPATGLVTFTGDDGTVIPAGTEVSTPGTDAVLAQRYTTDSQVTIAGGTATAPVTAVEPGAAGNVGTGAIDSLTAPLAGVSAVSNAAATAGGTDEEDDASLLQRLLTKVRNPATSGNVADYYNWALEVAGVGDAAVVPLASGPGTVTVAIVDTDMAPADPALVTAVQDYIDPAGAGQGYGQAPIGAAVTVVAATPVSIDVAADLTIDPAYTAGDVQAAVDAALGEYLSSRTFEADNDIRISQVTATILDVPGIIDATSVTLNGGTANIVIAPTEVAVLGTTTWT